MHVRGGTTCAHIHAPFSLSQDFEAMTPNLLARTVETVSWQVGVLC